MTRYGRNTSQTLKDNQLAPKKRFGQNFLVHQQTAESIVRSCRLNPDETIVEVGVGLGALTLPLSRAAKHVIGFEIDSGLVRYHQQEQDLSENVTIVHQDILKADFRALSQRVGGKIRLVANLPYSISNPFIFTLIENEQYVKDATIMLQKEVADRLMAEPGSKAYGVPTVLLRRCATVSKLLTLKPEQFHPRPKIDSVVVSINFEAPAIPSIAVERTLFTQIVRTTFNQRRKTIVNTLTKAAFFRDCKESISKNRIIAAIETANLQPEVRPEKLSYEDFCTLTNQIEQLLIEG